MAHIQHVMNVGQRHMRPRVLNCPVKIDLIGCSNQCFVVLCRRGALTDLWHPDIEGDFKEACVGLGCVEFQQENMFVSLQINSPSLKPVSKVLLICFMSPPLVPFLSLSLSNRAGFHAQLVLVETSSFIRSCLLIEFLFVFN